MIRLVQVGQQFDDFVLRGRVVAEFVLGELPKFFDASLAVHQAAPGDEQY